MYKKILVPVDGSPTSICGLREAIGLAKDQGATLRLVHVVDELLMDTGYAPAVDYQVFFNAIRENGKRTLERMVAQVRENGLEPESELLETIGRRAADLIVEAAAEWPADLIVMGTHGRRGVRRLLLGSDAELVLRHASMPVLMIRGDVPSSD